MPSILPGYEYDTCLPVYLLKQSEGMAGRSSSLKLVAKNIAKELKAVLSPVEVTEIDATPTNNLEAYNLYLKGRYYWAKRTVDGLRKAMDLFEQSIALDSAFIDAYAGLSKVAFAEILGDFGVALFNYPVFEMKGDASQI